MLQFNICLILYAMVLFSKNLLTILATFTFKTVAGRVNTTNDKNKRGFFICCLFLLPILLNDENQFSASMEDKRLEFDDT